MNYDKTEQNVSNRLIDSISALGISKNEINNAIENTSRNMEIIADTMEEYVKLRQETHKKICGEPTDSDKERILQEFTLLIRALGAQKIRETINIAKGFDRYTEPRIKVAKAEGLITGEKGTPERVDFSHKMFIEYLEMLVNFDKSKIQPISQGLSVIKAK